MINNDDSPIFVDSTLKVTAKEEIDMTKELAQENTQNLTIDQLLIQNDQIKK